MMARALTREEVATAQLDGDFAIKSEKTAPALDTSQWPLLLKNYDKLLVRSSHFTPIPTGCSPLKRDISSYVRYALAPHPSEVRTNKILGRALSILINRLTHRLTKSSLG